MGAASCLPCMTKNGAIQPNSISHTSPEQPKKDLGFAPMVDEEGHEDQKIDATPNNHLKVGDATGGSTNSRKKFMSKKSVTIRVQLNENNQECEDEMNDIIVKRETTLKRSKTLKFSMVVKESAIICQNIKKKQSK